MDENPSANPQDFAARQQAHAERVHLERQLQAQTGKSLSVVRRSLRADDGDRRFRQYVDAVRPRGQSAPQRPAPPAIQVTEVTLPKKQIFPGTSMTPGTVGDSSGSAGGDDPPTPAEDGVYVEVCTVVSGVPTITWQKTGTVQGCDGTDDVTVITLLAP